MDNHNFSRVPNGKICYIEIPTKNIGESAVFYSKVFGWNIRTRSDGSLAFDDMSNGVSGTWVSDREPHSGTGLRIYIMVDDVVAALEAIIANGGKVVDPISGTAPEFIATFSDLSGNIFGIAQE